VSPRGHRLATMAMLLTITSSLLVGMLLVLVPWTTLWDANTVLQRLPALRSLVLSGVARGVITGLGLVNVLLAVHDVIGLLRADRD
jgi:hypothetical protein